MTELRPALGKLAVLGQISERARELETALDHHTEPLDGTARPGDQALADWEHRVAADLAANGMLTWRVELLDAIYQLLARDDWPGLREALVNVAAECVVWIQHGDARGTITPPASGAVA